jgi:hypothetical protein
LLLILALLCTIIEGSRISTAKVYAQRAFTTALDSTLAGFYTPLWNEYHIFGLNTGCENFESNNTILTQTVKNYMEYTLNPDKGNAGVSAKRGVDIYDVSIDKTALQNQTKLMDYEGELFINQAVEYMKYAEIGDGLELLLDKLSLLEQPGKVSYIMEEKQKVEEELVEIDREILKLMKLYDGLMTSKKGIELDKNGALKTTQAFIKKICYADITMDSVGINNESVFQAQRNNYINPSTSYFTGIRSSFIQIENVQKHIDEIHADITALEELITECEAELSRLSSKDEKTDEDINTIKNLNLCIKAYSEDVKNLQNQIREQEELIKLEKGNINSLSASLNQLINELLPLHDDAIASINKIVNKTKLAAPLITGYETLLKGSKDGLPPEIYEGLEEELNQLKKYTSTDNSGYDFPGMLNILEDNKQILADTGLALKCAQEALKSEEYAAAAGLYITAEDYLMRYQIQGLKLDYSTLVYDNNNQKDALDKVNDVIAGGLSSLVINPKDISEAMLNSTDTLPSFIHALTDEKTNYSNPIAAFFTNAKTGDRNSAAEDLFNVFQEGTNIKDLMTEGLNRLAETVLFREYLDEHFSSYQPKNMLSEAQKPASIEYEQEYLIIGKNTDAANLNAVISRIFLVRMIFDLISVLSDSSIRNEAKLIAASLVGFTGLPILVFLTQMLILLIWSFAEALLDTTALMMGKKVPIIKKKVVMTFTDVFLLTREQLSRKAASLPDTKELSLNYGNYLKIFLLMTGKEKLAFRSVDLIQENLKLRYKDDEFKIMNCLYGFEMSAQFGIKRKFTSFGFLKKYYDSNQDSYQFSTLAADSY